MQLFRPAAVNLGVPGVRDMRDKLHIFKQHRQPFQRNGGVQKTGHIEGVEINLGIDRPDECVPVRDPPLVIHPQIKDPRCNPKKDSDNAQPHEKENTAEGFGVHSRPVLRRAQCRQKPLLVIRPDQRADIAKENRALAIQNEGLWRGCDAPINGRATLRVKGHADKRVTIRLQIARGRPFGVAEIHPDDRNAIRRHLQQLGMLGPAGRAPRGPEIHQCDLAPRQITRPDARKLGQGLFGQRRCR
mmetsp:Transcript_22928/g.38539  ORF Transcript_22928/g.38539 Transcript_22928/m.38539 type:complete len:244 (+) Transcript_22928:1163-1894(+)